MYSLPYDVIIDGKKHKIRNKCDYRVVLDTINALNDEEMEIQDRYSCALYIFFENAEDVNDKETALKEMLTIINNGEEEKNNSTQPQYMDWEHDFKYIAPPVSNNLGYDVREPEEFTHWWTFLGAFMEIGESTFSTIISIRKKRMQGKKLEKWEQEFYASNKNMVDLPMNISEADEEWLLG